VYRGFMRFLALTLPVLLFASCSNQMAEEEIIAHATELHRSVITIDSHDDIPANFATDEVDPGVRDGRQVTLPKMREGGLDVAFFVVYVGQGERNPEGYAAAKAAAITKFDAIHRMAEKMYPEQVELAYTPDDVERINGMGQLAAVICIENGYVIGRDLSLLETYHSLGARYMTLTHGGHNDIGDSSTPREQLGDAEEEHGGLSEFGERVVTEMNRLGIMVDVSHVSKNTMLDAARLSQAPIIASHSSTRTLADHPRNLDDEQLLALKENGGVAQMVALGGFVKVMPEKDAALQELREELGLTSYAAMREMSDETRAEYEARQAELDEQWPPATVADFVDHIDYAVELIGIDHVGISSDFDGGGGIEGWNDASESLNVTIELVRRGYTDEEVAKLWGGNLLRVWRETEAVAQELQQRSTD
jgi:membrane dipeptidase